MLLGALLYFLSACLVFVGSEQTGNDTGSQATPPLLLVSFDGFRADYLKQYSLPNLQLFFTEGVLVDHLTNVFITKTFPNHYSLVTGLYPESHGMLASRMYDPVTRKHFSISNDSDSFWWNEATPIWVSALSSGYRTGAAMWPGSDVQIQNRTPTHFLKYDPSVTFAERLGNLTSWLSREDGVKFATLYWEEPDQTGHRYGPENTTAIGRALREVDEHVGLLMKQLKQMELWNGINVILTSDHGMTQCSSDRLILLDHCLHPDNYTVVDLTPVAAILPKADTADVFNLLKSCHAHMKAYMKSSIPDWLHYRNNDRIQPIILIADEGWTIVQRGHLPRLGDHGYDNSLPSMHPFLAARGPSFRKGIRVDTFESVDVYPLMCHLLGLQERPNNGSFSRVRCLLAGQSCVGVPLVVGVVVGVLLVLSTLTVLFRIMKPRGNPSSRPFARLELQEDDDDDEPLLN